MIKEMPEVEFKQFLMRTKLIAKYNEQEIYFDHESETYYHVTQEIVDGVVSAVNHGEFESLGEASYAAAEVDKWNERMRDDNGSIVSVGGLVTKIANKERK